MSFNLKNVLVKGKKTSKKFINSELVIENKSDDFAKVIFFKPIMVRRKNFSLTVNIDSIEGEQPIIKLLSVRLKCYEEIKPNSTYFWDVTPFGTFIALKVAPHSKFIIKAIKYKIGESRKKDLETKFNSGNKILMIVPMYPSNDNKYSCAFLHSRIKAYRKRGLDVDLAVVNHTEQYHYYYKYDGVEVNNISYNDIREILQIKKYDKILIHFLSEEYAQILDATDLSETEVVIYSHGADNLYRDRNIFETKYFSPKYVPTQEEIKKFDKLDKIISRYNQMKNFTFVFVSLFAKNRSEKLIGIKYNNYKIIPCVIDESIYKYKKKDIKQRFKICMIRSFHNLNSYSIDTNVKTILALSKKSIFHNLEFAIYGKGEMHDILLAPIKDFPNVKIYNEFLSFEEMADMYSKNGISLFATRYDTQGVATLESAMCGTIPITSYGTGISCYLDESIGNFTDATDYNAMADLIENLVLNPSLFSKMSEAVHKSVLKNCSEKDTIEKELKFLKRKSIKRELIKQKALDEKPLLTIAIPAYNCDKFLYNTVYSLIDHDYNNRVEILIINDGSKDDTAKIGKELEKISPSVRLIDKENGGHGSTINVGIKEAKGKYFRLLDGDDYFITDAFVKYLLRLEKETADIVLTNYIEDFSIDAFKNPKLLYSNMEPYQLYDFELLTYSGYGFEGFGPLLSTSTYKTNNLRSLNFDIDHHCFYVDMEYNFMGAVSASTVIYYPLNIYCYYLGRAGQSMAPESMKRNYLNHEKVTMRLVKEYSAIKDSLPKYKQKYIVNRLIIPMVAAQYYIAIETVKTRKAFNSFDKKLKNYKEFYNNETIVGRKIKLHRLTNGISVYLQVLFHKIRKK